MESGCSSTRGLAIRRTSSISAMARPRSSTRPASPPNTSRQPGVGVSPRWTIDTHSHADYVTGSPSLAVEPGITFIAPAASKLETPHQPVRDEELIDLAAGVALRAIATPGHTPDHHVYLVESDGSPVALFTGGSLMVGAVGRTDLCGPDLAEPLAHEMFHSLRRLDGLPDDLAVYPTHGAGSFCSAPGGADRTTTLGRERASNALVPDRRRGHLRRAAAGRVRVVPDLLRPAPRVEPARATPVSAAACDSTGSMSTPSTGMSRPER